MNKEVGRNDPCPCGSGKKYKKCCGLKEGMAKHSATVLGSSTGKLFERISRANTHIKQVEESGSSTPSLADRNVSAPGIETTKKEEDNPQEKD